MNRIGRVMLLMLSLVPVLLRPVRASDLDKLKQLVREKFPDVQNISTDRLAGWLTDQPPPILIDVRSEAEFAVSHLPGARRTRDPKTIKGLSAQTPIVVYCAVGYRSAQFVRELQKQGFTNVWNLEGSIFQWANEGRPVYRGADSVRHVHPYNRKWGRLLNPELHPSSK